MKSNFRKILGVSMSVAMLTSMLVTASPAMALSTPVVTTNSTTVAATNAFYDVRFSVGATLNGSVAGTNISITFSSGFVLPDTTFATNITGYTIAAGPGWLSPSAFGDAVVNATAANSTAATRRIVITLGAGDIIGADAQVRIVIPAGAVTNPTATGSYNVTVSTSNETTAVTSNNIEMTLPSLGLLPGIITAKNSVGQTLYQSTDGNINTALAQAGVSRVELAPGYYTTAVTGTTVNVTIIGVGTGVYIGNTTSTTALTVNAAGTTIENVIINGSSNGLATSVAASANSTFKNVTFVGGLIQLAVSGASTLINVQNCIFNVTGNVSTGITTSNALVVTSSNFTVDGSGTGISNTGNLTVTGSVFSGSSTSTGISVGTGASASTNDTAIRSNTFTSLRQALVIGNENVTVNGNTITGGGESTASDTRGVITQSNGVLLLTNNTITNWNNAYYAIHVSGGSLSARFNTITSTGTVLNVRETGGTANATLNWWGVSTGPTAASINATTPNNVHVPHLTGAVTGSGSVAFNTANLTARDIASVDVSTSNGTMGAVSAVKYAANPQTVAPPGTGGAYYDVYIDGAANVGTVTIRFYGSVNDNSKVYYGGGLTGAWALVDTQGVNTAGGYAFVTLTNSTNLRIADMSGTPFVVTTIVPPPAAPALAGPTAGATGVPTNTGFSWSAVAGATYDFQVSTSPTFATLTGNVSNLSSNVYGGVALAANTTYFWRVRSMSGTPMQMSAWTVSTFTTAAAGTGAAVVVPPAQVTVNPAPITVQAPPAPNVTVQAPPPANVTVNPPTVNVAAPPPAQVTVNVPEQSPAIPTSILWVIILIGAVLIIALIVLIVRTRRVA